ncbi:MAG TPA: ferrochelatase [Nocardioidaceae bacterium]|nr:ferrochelatase [Nocardioidaceae bacterium]
MADVSGHAEPYDALLLVSFGGPEGPGDVLPFLENVTRGRPVPRERLEQVAEHYLGFGGRSPINDQNRALLAAVEADLAAHDIDVGLYWGNRNWDPFLGAAVEQMAADGVRRAACLVTSAYSSYSGCRQYRENLFDAAASVAGAPRLDRLRHYGNHPGFVAPFVDATVAALREMPVGSRLVFVTHSIPVSMARTSGPEGHAYERQHQVVAAEVARQVGDAGWDPDWDLAYCSRSGSPRTPWLEPDVNDQLEALAKAGVPGAVVVPIGFVSDHMEVIHDLDTEARATAHRLGLPMARVATPGTDPRFVAMVRELLVERAAVERGERAVRPTVAGTEPLWDRCPAGCCADPAREHTAERPAVGGR